MASLSDVFQPTWIDAIEQSREKTGVVAQILLVGELLLVPELHTFIDEGYHLLVTDVSHRSTDLFERGCAFRSFTEGIEIESWLRGRSKNSHARLKLAVGPCPAVPTCTTLVFQRFFSARV